MSSPSRKVLLDWSQENQEIFSYDQHEKTFTIEHKEDVEPLIKFAKDMSELQPSKEWKLSAIIPQFALDDSLRNGWFSDKKKWKKWANDHANKPFRVWQGRL